jgi:hypothetical protein
MISMFLSVSLKKKIVTNFFLTIFFLTESFIMMTYSTYNICLCVTYSFIMMAPDAPELSRTKLVSDFVSALRASGVGSVDVKQHLMCCYDAYAQQVYVSTSSYAVECLHLLPLARFISLQAPGGPEPALPNTGVATNGHGNRPPGEVSSIVSSLAGKHGPPCAATTRMVNRYMYVCVCVFVCVYVYVHMYVYVCVQTHTHTHTHTHMYTIYIYIYIYIYVYTHIYVYT